MSNTIYKNKAAIIKNIKTIRCFLELNKTEFSEKAHLGKRGEEFENGRFRPTMEELQRIADLAEINVQLIINHKAQTELKFY